MPDEALVQAVLLEFERAGSPVAGFHCVAAIIRPCEGPALSRVVLIDAQGKSVLVDSPTEPEALGRALIEHLSSKDG